MGERFPKPRRDRSATHPLRVADQGTPEARRTIANSAICCASRPFLRRWKSSSLRESDRTPPRLMFEPRCSPSSPSESWPGQPRTGPLLEPYSVSYRPPMPLQAPRGRIGKPHQGIVEFPYYWNFVGSSNIKDSLI
jgi:hypothetical protein